MGRDSEESRYLYGLCRTKNKDEKLCESCHERFLCYTSEHPTPLEPFMKLKNGETLGDLFTLANFEEYCKTGMFVDYDGSGYYATENGVSRIEANPSEVRAGKVIRAFTHVMWYNK